VKQGVRRLHHQASLGDPGQPGFKVQRDLLTTFHVSDPKQFSSSHDFWQVPDDPATQAGSTTAGKQPPYYMGTGADGRGRRQRRGRSGPGR
jgi:uncharacterized membrane protein (UPF0182 family)